MNDPDKVSMAASRFYHESRKYAKVKGDVTIHGESGITRIPDTLQQQHCWNYRVMKAASSQPSKR